MAGATAALCWPGDSLADVTTSDDAHQFQILRRNWSETKTGGIFLHKASPFADIVDALDDEASKWLGNMSAGPERTTLYEDADATGEQIYNTRVSLERIRIITVAFSTPGSSLFNQPDVLARIVDALEFIGARRYNPALQKVGNWWEWEIGVPMSLLDILVLVYAEVPPALIHTLSGSAKFFIADVKLTDIGPGTSQVSTAANQVWKAHVLFLTAIIDENVSSLRQAIAALLETFHDAASGDGFHEDGSFIQHKVFAYTGGYGIDFLYRASGLIYALRGSAFAISSDQWAPLLRWSLTAYAPLMVDGGIMDMCRGRNMSRSYTLEHEAGHHVIYSLIYLAEVAPPGPAHVLKQMIKTWISRDVVRPFFKYDPKSTYRLSLDTARLAASYISDRTLAELKPIRQNYQFTAMDRWVFRRETFTVGLALNSKRIGSFESINGENGHGWYSGAGTIYLYNSAYPYQSNFWPTVDPYRMPGTTVVRQALEFGQGSGQLGCDRVGGASSGEYSVVCMELPGDSPGVYGKKAWFIFGDIIIALGTGITSTADQPVETILENRSFDAGEGRKVGFMTGGKEVPLLPVATATKANWAHIDKVAGYVIFDGEASVRALRETRTGSWQDINHQGYSDPQICKRDYLTLWLDHGHRPAHARYGYAILPGATIGATKSLAKTLTRRDIVNQDDYQAYSVFDCGKRITGVVFWAAGTTKGVSSSAPACVLLIENHDTLQVVVSDPTQKQTMSIHLTIFGISGKVFRSDPAFVTDSSGQGFTLIFSPSETFGEPRSVLLKGIQRTTGRQH